MLREKMQWKIKHWSQFLLVPLYKQQIPKYPKTAKRAPHNNHRDGKPHREILSDSFESKKPLSDGSIPSSKRIRLRLEIVMRPKIRVKRSHPQKMTFFFISLKRIIIITFRNAVSPSQITSTCFWRINGLVSVSTRWKKLAKTVLRDRSTSWKGFQPNPKEEVAPKNRESA